VVVREAHPPGAIEQSMDSHSHKIVAIMECSDVDQVASQGTRAPLIALSEFGHEIPSCHFVPRYDGSGPTINLTSFDDGDSLGPDEAFSMASTQILDENSRIPSSPSDEIVCNELVSSESAGATSITSREPRQQLFQIHDNAFDERDTLESEGASSNVSSEFEATDAILEMNGAFSERTPTAQPALTSGAGGIDSFGFPVNLPRIQGLHLELSESASHDADQASSVEDKAKVTTHKMATGRPAPALKQPKAKAKAKTVTWSRDVKGPTGSLNGTVGLARIVCALQHGRVDLHTLGETRSSDDEFEGAAIAVEALSRVAPNEKKAKSHDTIAVETLSQGFLGGRDVRQQQLKPFDRRKTRYNKKLNILSKCHDSDDTSVVL
jgi:hypothetical protein